MFHFQQKCPEEMVVSWKRWSEKVVCGAHRHTEAANEKENWNYCAVVYRTERPAWCTVRQHLRFHYKCWHVALEPGIQLQFSSCGSLHRNGIGWTSANAGDVLRRRPCRELPCFLWSYLFWGSFPLGFVLLMGQAACMQRANDAKACLERNCRPA